MGWDRGNATWRPLWLAARLTTGDGHQSACRLWTLGSGPAFTREVHPLQIPPRTLWFDSNHLLDLNFEPLAALPMHSHELCTLWVIFKTTRNCIETVQCKIRCNSVWYCVPCVEKRVERMWRQLMTANYQLFSLKATEQFSYSVWTVLSNLSINKNRWFFHQKWWFSMYSIVENRITKWNGEVNHSM